MDAKPCEICGKEPATPVLKPTAAGEPERVEWLCDVHAAEAHTGRGNLLDDIARLLNSEEDFGDVEESEEPRGGMLPGPGAEQASGSGTVPKGHSSTPTLDQFSRDLTLMAAEGKLNPVIGRSEEVEITTEVLSRLSKNNPVLIGDPGVGKTAIVEGIAQRIFNGDVPDTLSGRRVVELDLSEIVAGTQYRGQFEERLKKIIDEVRENSHHLIVFIDELHTLVGAGASGGSMDASNMLKPALARGELHVVGATTIEEYRTYVEKDPALARRFEAVLVRELKVNETIDVLRGLKERFEAHHKVKITEGAIAAAAELSDRYVTDRFLPDKAIGFLDQAAARARLRLQKKPQTVETLEEDIERCQQDKRTAVAAEDFARAQELKERLEHLEGSLERAKGASERDTEVLAEDVADVVSRATGIPVSQVTQEERERLLQLEERLHSRVVGQDDAVAAVAKSVRRARAGLSTPNRPIGSFLFLGPTGVGKTELARTLAEALFGDDAAMVRMDMSEFQEKHTISRLIGSPPGYVGSDEGGQLTERVRRRPYSVVLLDEIEKAHPDVLDILLQVLDDGRLTDAQGRTVNFTNTIIIMTSNLGADRIRAHTLNGAPFDDLKEEMEQLLARVLRPEFVNRIDDITVFRMLTKEHLGGIARILLGHTVKLLHAQSIEAEFTDGAVDILVEEGFDPEFGARPLRRAIQRKVDDRLSSMILEGSLEPGDKVVIGADAENLTFKAITAKDTNSGGLSGAGP